MLWDFTQWPTIPLDNVPRKNRKRYLRNQQIIAQVLSGIPLYKVARLHQLTPGRLSQLLARCLGGNIEDPPALTVGLIPNRHVLNKRRVCPLPTLKRSRGYAYAFRALLEKIPNLSKEFDAMIMAKLKDEPYAQYLAPQPFHGLLKKLLAEANWPKDRYPYTSESLAYASVRRYLNKRTAELQQAQQLRRQPPPRDLGIPPRRIRAQRALQIDEQLIDFKGSVHLVLNEELIPLRVARASVSTAVDVDTTCILGYTLDPTRNPNQQDMLGLFDACINPWQPLTLTTPGLSYAPGACFPSGAESAFPISFGTVQMDNALMHRAQSVIDFLCIKTGATLNCGLPGMPVIRHVVESVFRYINQHCSHRFASTTGSYPTDPKKESRKNQKYPPIITWRTLMEALSVILTEYNITPQAALGNVSPLELFLHQCSTHFVRYVPPILTQQWQPLISEQILPLHWNRKEKRLPYVYFYYERYKGRGLLNVASQEKQIRVKYHRKDLRKLQAFTLDGEDLGELHVASPWRRYAHSLATRKWIHRNAKQYHLNMRDPLSSLFRYLLHNKNLPETALTLLRIYDEFTFEQPGGLVLGEGYDNLENMKPPSKILKKYHWHPGSANHR